MTPVYNVVSADQQMLPRVFRKGIPDVFFTYE